MNCSVPFQPALMGSRYPNYLTAPLNLLAVFRRSLPQPLSCLRHLYRHAVALVVLTVPLVPYAVPGPWLAKLIDA